jgi:hypothetical protein
VRDNPEGAVALKLLSQCGSDGISETRLDGFVREWNDLNCASSGSITVCRAEPVTSASGKRE